MEIRFLILAFTALLTTADGYCSSTILYATTNSQTKSVSASYYAYCSISIRPSWYYSSSSYYLEISWSSSNFDVKGNMPFCKEDYVEVFLTSSHRSIGKFCSNNAGRPFTMYSRDSYAKINYKTDGYANGKGFTFYYKLKLKTSAYLGGYPSSTYCYNTRNSAESGVIYSTGWPRGYQWSYSSCDYKIEKSYHYQGAVVVFMDINMYPYGYPSDCVQLYGSNYSNYYTNTISSQLCYTSYMKKYTSYDSYLKISFDRRNGPSYSSYRGFVAGYIKFKTPSPITDKTPGSSSSSAVAIALGVLIPAIVIFVIIVAICAYNKKRRGRTATAVSSNQTQTTGTVSTSHQAAAQQTAQAASSISYTNAAFSTQQYVYPTSTIQGGGYLTGSYAMSYSSRYPSVPYNAVGNTNQQASFLVAPSNTMQQPQLTGSQQQTGGVTFHTSGPPASQTAVYSSTIPPVEASPNVPPPPYTPIVSS